MTTVRPPSDDIAIAGALDCAEAAVIRAACAATAREHDRLCPRQVLGVRMGLAGAAALDVPLPNPAKRLLVFAETDGCFVDGVGAATECTVGHRTLRVVDYGRVAITMLDTCSGRAVRVAPKPGVRMRALDYAPGESRRYYAQMRGYQVMPASELLCITPVTLTLDLATVLGTRGVRVDCSGCGEEVLNGRERPGADGPVCAGCADDAYYAAVVSAEIH